MSLPIAWIDRIFERMTLRYGRDFLGRWEGIPIADVKTDWADVLSGFFTHPSAIAWALESLPDSKPPTVQEFRALCRAAPAPEIPRLPEPKADPGRVSAELAKLAPVRAAAAAGGYDADPKSWARRILDRHNAGGRINALPLKMAREVCERYGV